MHIATKQVRRSSFTEDDLEFFSLFSVDMFDSTQRVSEMILEWSYSRSVTYLAVTVRMDWKEQVTYHLS